MKSNEVLEPNQVESGGTSMDAPAVAKSKPFLKTPAVRYALLIFLVSRLLLTVWAIVITIIQPIPDTVDERLRPYLGAPVLNQGPAGYLLGPWQRFDTMRYLRIARQGYEEVEDSVFPPLYPLAINGLGRGFSLLVPDNQAGLLAALTISNLSFIGALILLYQLVEYEADSSTARRSIVYFALFPTAFYLTAAYSEALFIFFTLASIYAARRDRFWLAGSMGFLATITRSTGVFLAVPLACEYLLQRGFDWRQPQLFRWRRLEPAALATVLPVLSGLLFLLYRQAMNLPSISEVYRQYWYQATGFPGRDILTSLSQIVAGGAPFRLFIDLFCGLLLIAITWLALRRLRLTYGLYSFAMLLFILLPTSELKPLYSFSRYVLAFFPTFILFGMAGKNPWINRLIVYPSLAFYLFLSGQFFMWGWVA